jgi:hypothetical protein
LLAFMAAETWPRWFAGAAERIPALSRAAVPLAATGAAAVAFVVHPMAARYERAVLPVARALQAGASADFPTITNTRATLKYLSPVYGRRPLISLEFLPADSLAAFSSRFDTLSVTLLDRSDSQVFLDLTAEHDAFIAQVVERCNTTPVVEQRLPDMRIRTLRASGCR